ncbi:MAG: CHRD domain-containing protein, partial [bacterium]
MRKGLLVPLMLSLVLLQSLPGIAGWIALDQAQGVPAPTSVPGAAGTGVVELEEDEGELYYDITVTGLSGPITAAHFHGPAGPGESASPVRTVTFEGNHAVGVWSSTDSEPLTPAFITALKEGKIYFNVHTQLNGAGEIRGQVHIEPSFNGSMNQAVEVPAPQPVAGAAGTVFAILNETETELTYNATVTGLSGPITA